MYCRCYKFCSRSSDNSSKCDLSAVYKIHVSSSSLLSSLLCMIHRYTNTQIHTPKHKCVQQHKLDSPQTSPHNFFQEKIHSCIFSYIFWTIRCELPAGMRGIVTDAGEFHRKQSPSQVYQTIQIPVKILGGINMFVLVIYLKFSLHTNSTFHQ